MVSVGIGNPLKITQISRSSLIPPDNAKIERGTQRRRYAPRSGSSRLDVIRSACAVAYLPFGEGWRMVCTSTTTGTRIAGGFVLLNVAALMTAWRGCQARPLGIGEFRAWLACHELEARRCGLGEGRAAIYGVAELARLLGVTKRRARASVNRLEAAGLIQWSDSAIGFPDPPHQPADGLDDTIGRGKGTVAIPRRMLRFLAAGARPAMSATVLGLLLRCLSRRKAGWDGRGRVKSSWIAGVFDVSLRQAKAARRELLDLGWIGVEPADQWVENRWGRAFRINLDWSSPGATSAPLPPVPGSPSTPPDLQTGNPSGRMENQEPGRGPSGFSSKDPGEKDRAPARPLDAPKLAAVRFEDLKDTGQLLDLHQQAVARKSINAGEGNRLRFVAAAEHALMIGDRNPAGLFAWVVRGACWRYITAEAEDRARERLRVHDFGPARMSAATIHLGSSRSVGPSGDARRVKEFRDLYIRSGIFRDPFPEVSKRYPDWTLERWNRGLMELGFPPLSG